MPLQHTPAPWKAWHSDYANAPTVIYAGARAPSLNAQGSLRMNGSFKIAEVDQDESPDNRQRKANALLITAAPLLLMVCEELLERYPSPAPVSEGLSRILAMGHHAVFVATGRF